MKYKPIVVAGEPNSIFECFKSLRKLNLKSPLILIASKELVKLEMKRFNFKKIKLLDLNNLKQEKLDNKYLNLISVKYKNYNYQKKILPKSNEYIQRCFEIAFMILKKHNFNKLINGPINKKKFLNKKFLGITEYISHKFKINKNAMLIFNPKLSVCPVTTHLPLNMFLKIKKYQLLKKQS